MTVAELIEKLKLFPMNAEVVFNVDGVNGCDEFYSVEDVRLIDGGNRTVELLP